MAELLVEYTDVVLEHDAARYVARAWGAAREDGKWEGWLEFTDPATGRTLRSARETTQPRRGDTIYWASGLTAVYLEGAFERALDLEEARMAPPAALATEDADRTAGLRPSPADSILDPFSVYLKGETLLRRQLAALSGWHLVNIIQAHDLTAMGPDALNALPVADLIEVIVDGVKARLMERTLE